MNETVILKREDLYELVWARPLTHLAREFGLSDVGFAKHCRKMKIPLPGPGYWTRVKHGVQVKIPPLPPVHDPKLQQVRLGRAIKAVPKAATREEDPVIAIERLLENRISVQTTLISPHPLVKATIEALKRREPDKYGRIQPYGPQCLDIRVSPASQQRALLVMDALIKAFDTRGMKVFVKTGNFPNTHVYVQGEDLEIGIEEQATQVEHKLTPEELERLERYSHSWAPKHDFFPSGKLTLMLRSYLPVKKIWRDTEKNRIEDCLNEFVIGLIRAANMIKQNRSKEEGIRLAWEEEERRREETEQRKREEEEKLKMLDRQVAAWTKSRQIREFIAAVKAAANRECGFLEAISDLDEWIEWANRQADWLDPLAAKKHGK
jgi:hypothetical protein